MREIVLDTETTGFEPNDGDRIVEIGAVELLNYLPTGKTYHQYINPKRNMPEGAFSVHGLSEEFLSDKPTFDLIAGEFIDFVADSKLIIHNASFDMKFLNAELSWINYDLLPLSKVIDTLALARKKFPGSPASLDALCRRFSIDNSARTLHGALLDSEILAEIYLELVGGRQPDLVLSGSSTKKKNEDLNEASWRTPIRPNTLPQRLTEKEKEAHKKFISEFDTDALWNSLT